MWSRKSWGGDIDPFIAVNFRPKPDAHDDEIVSLLIFEWEDGNYLGRLPSKDSEEVCTLPNYLLPCGDGRLIWYTEKVHLRH